MPKYPSDTHPEAEEVQYAIMRKKTPAERIGMMRSLTAMVVANSRQAIREAHPEFTEFEVKVFWMELAYGAELAEAFRERFAHASG